MRVWYELNMTKLKAENYDPILVSIINTYTYVTIEHVNGVMLINFPLIMNIVCSTLSMVLKSPRGTRYLILHPFTAF